MSEVSVFQNEEFGTVRTVAVDGEVYFVAKDVADILGYSETQAMTRRLDDDEKGMQALHTPGGEQNLTVVNESGLYNAIIGSNKPEAKKFKKWVTSEVLPSIRKHGVYATDNFVELALSDPQHMIEVLTRFKEERQKRIEAESTVAILTHVNKLYTATEIAKEIGFKSAQALNKDLHDKRIQFNQSGTWVFYSDYASLGYDSIKQEVLDNGTVVYHRKFTQRGREFILGLYKGAYSD